MTLQPDATTSSLSAAPLFVTPPKNTRDPRESAPPLPVAGEHYGEFLARFRSGEPDALELVYEYYVGHVRRWLTMGFTLGVVGTNRVGGLRDGAALQDAVQEVFLRALSPKVRHSYDGVRPFRSLLARIARNVRIDQLRAGRHEVPSSEALEVAARRPSATMGPDQIQEADGESIGAEAALDWTRKRAATLRFLQTLDPLTRRFTELRFVEELSQSDVADALGISRTRVRTLERRVLRDLRAWLRRELAPQMISPHCLIAS